MNADNEGDGGDREDNGFEDDENGRDNVQEDENENENYDENGQQFEGEYNYPVIQDNIQHQENRPKYNSA